ncbi:MAG TPA: folylpolyglutamate synthase/dihydrofolate synthase family protein [Acidobacteriota bacterium]
MNFAQCRAYLDSLQVLGIKLGLDSIRTLLKALGNPHLNYPTLLVAGTNGKGSVCAMLTRILSRHGLRAGLYTSPHLVAVEERIRVNDRLISRPAFCRALTGVRKAADSLLRAGTLPSPPTHFEVLTCAALSYFKTTRVDIAVLEVGMGGRFDATNVVTPILSVITSIGRDHEKYLGHTIDQIAFEKAGIIKPEVPVVSGVLRPTAAAVIRKRARELQAPYLGALDPPHTLKAVKSRTGYRFVYDLAGKKYSFSPGLAGLHQGRNAAVALAAAVRLGQVWRPLQKALIIRGIEETRWPGRLETVRRSPRAILDGAHNPDGVRALRDYMSDFVRRPVILVFGVMKDKDISGLARILFPVAKKIILTKFPYHRAAEPADILRKARPFAGRILIEPDPSRAYRLALAEARRRKGCVLVAGSLFLVGAIKSFLAGNGHHTQQPG